MKTRIISGVVAIALLIAVLYLNTLWSPTAVIFVSILSALAAWEMLNNTGSVKVKVAVFTAMFYSFAVQFSYAGILHIPSELLTVVYFLLVVVIALVSHPQFTPAAITITLSMPIVISFAFGRLVALLNSGDGFGLFYVIILLNFSSVSDMFAYFTGMLFGKHKLAPVISPKKTVEGAVGGIIGSVIGTIVISLIFNGIYGQNINTLSLCLITPVMAVIGIMGDLFTSAIKRSYKIKDYGNLIPGHGGVLDRFDSILILAPVFYLLLSYVEVIT